MNIEKALALFHKLTDFKRVQGEIDIKSSDGNISFSYHIHADPIELSRIMAVFVKETGIKLTKHQVKHWQSAVGNKGNVSGSFYPRGHAFRRCQIKQTKRRVFVPAQPAHYEDKITHKVVCDGELL